MKSRPILAKNQQVFVVLKICFDVKLRSLVYDEHYQNDECCQISFFQGCGLFLREKVGKETEDLGIDAHTRFPIAFIFPGLKTRDIQLPWPIALAFRPGIGGYLIVPRPEGRGY
jgi:hypothetical protein